MGDKEFNINDLLGNIEFEKIIGKPFEVTVDLRAEKPRRSTQNILVSLDRYEELIKAEQDAEYLKEWVAKASKNGKNSYEVKAELELLDTIFNGSEGENAK